MVGNYPNHRPYSKTFAWLAFGFFVAIGAILLGSGFSSGELLTTGLGWGSIFAGGVAAVILSIFASEDSDDWFVLYGWVGIAAITLSFWSFLITTTVFLLN